MRRYCFVIYGSDVFSFGTQKAGVEEFGTPNLYYIDRKSADSRSNAKFFVDALSELKQKGYWIDNKAKSAFQYWQSRYNQELQEQIEQVKKEEVKKVLQNHKYERVLWCNKLGCRTSQKSCERCTRFYQIGCRPAQMKIRAN